jgi:hypothetical protein
VYEYIFLDKTAKCSNVCDVAIQAKLATSKRARPWPSVNHYTFFQVGYSPTLSKQNTSYLLDTFLF